MGLAYERLGAGPPLVLLHGLGHRRQAWDAVTGLLSPYREVVLVDLPGHGESPPLRLDGQPVRGGAARRGDRAAGRAGAGAPARRRELAGRRLALEAGVAGRARTVTALAPAGFFRSEGEARYGRAVFKIMETAGAHTQRIAPALARSTAGRAVVFGAIVSKPSQLTAEQARDDMAAFVASREAINVVLAGMTNFTGRVPDGVPVTIGWGMRDRLLFPRQARMAKARLPEARLVRMRGCGHVPMTDDPALVADVLLRGSARA